MTIVKDISDWETNTYPVRDIVGSYMGGSNRDRIRRNLEIISLRSLEISKNARYFGWDYLGKDGSCMIMGKYHISGPLNPEFMK